MFWLLATLTGLGLLAWGLHYWQHTDLSMAQQEHRRKLGAVYMTLNNPYYQVVDEEIRTVVENHGDVLLTRDPALSVERQQAEIQELIDDGVELLFVTPADWREMQPALQLAYEAHIPVVCIDTDVKDDKYVACTVVSDNYEAGVQCAQHLLSHSDGGRIALLTHNGALSGVERIHGFRDTIAQDDRFQIVAEEDCLGQLERAMPAMLHMLAAHPDIDIVMALNDPSAMGAMAALESQGRLDKVRVYGVDGVPETKHMIAQGHMTATAAQSPRQIGQLAAAQAYHILQGEPCESYLKLPTRLLTQDNIAACNIEGWD